MNPEIIILALVFAATVTLAWLLVPQLAAFGLERTAHGYLADGSSSQTPMHRFTTPRRLSALRVGGSIILIALIGAILLAAGIRNIWVVMACLGLAGKFGAELPKWWLSAKIRGRQLEFERQLVDFLQAVSGAMRAGSDVLNSIRRVAKDFPGPIGEEFNLFIFQKQWNLSLEQALENLMLRMPSEDLRIVSTALRVSGRAGGKLADILDRIAETVRERLDFAERVRTKTMQARFEAWAMASAPLWAFVILFTLDRNLMEPLVTTQQGWVGIAIAMGLAGTGMIFIRRITDIEG